MLPIGHEGPHYSDDDDLIWREPTTEERQAFAVYVRDDPPEYDPEADAAGRADEWAAGQRELADIEAGARDAAAEAAWEATHPVSPPDPDSRGGA